jgi:hypothetical protein
VTVAGDDVPKMGTPEWNAQQLAKALLEQDAALGTLRQREAVRHEEFDPDAEERRRWALAQAVNDAPAELMGRDPGGEAVWLPNDAMVLVHRKNGLISEMRPAVFQGGVILPHEWEAHDKAWREHARRSENVRLASRYGVAEMVAAGIMTADDAAHPDVVAAAAARAERRARQAAHYDLERSVG